MEKLLTNKSEGILAKLKTNSKLSIGELESKQISEEISTVLLKAKRTIDKNQKNSKLEASKLILSH